MVSENSLVQQDVTQGTTQPSQVLGLSVGDWVEVRTVEEILATLDQNGELDGTPFMPEMLQFTGSRFPVYKLAHKTCDTATRTGGRSLTHTVHLQTRCDGSGHGGCQAGCLIFWKEAWLKRAPADPASRSPVAVGSKTPATANGPVTLVQLAQLERAASRPDPNDPNSPIYSCQATKVPTFTKPLPWWDVRQYFRDVTSGNTSLKKASFVIGRAVVNAIQRKRGGRGFPSFPVPTKTKTPRERLDLQPGELVQVKSKEEIADTLDTNYRNRGLFFDVELIRWCGGTYRVKTRVEQIINEQTGKMMRLPNDCIILESVACASECSRNRLLCPREIHHYWREIWLRRVPAPAGAVEAPRATGSVAAG